jgi:magnesium transporter
MPEAEASEARLLLQYAPDTAGGVMITEYLSYPDHVTVEDVAEDLWAFGEHYSDYEIQYAYITDGDGTLSGVLRLRDLLLAQRHIPVRDIMIENPVRVPVEAGLQALHRLFDAHPFFGVPAVDPGGRLVGVVRRAAVEEALGGQATDAFLAVSGIVGEDELRTMPILRRSRRRLSWLSINIVLNILAASVIAFYQDTLSAVIALAVFLPIISDMSGCSGNQAVAVSIRELALGLLKPYEYARVILKEGAVGMINGLVLGVLLGVVAAVWQDNIFLGLVVGTALMFNTLIAVLLGGLIPLGLKSLRQDPALASGPILTTVTDMMGFLMVLSFASTMLSRLT